MNLRQLRTFCEIVDSGLRLSDAAQATYRSQSSVTRQIQLLEKELGLDLFVRKRNRLIRLTPQAEEILDIARRILQDAENLRRIGRNINRDDEGTFAVATTHTHARYVLPPVVRGFVGKYPKVQLTLRQGTPNQCCELLTLGKADIAICADPPNLTEDLVQIPCFVLYRSVITPPRHPLLKVKPITLDALARYPLITYGEAFNGGWIVSKTFVDRGLRPNILLSAVDADVSKAYVGMGLGIAIFVSVAFDPKQDSQLRRIDARHLFKPSYLNLILRRHSHLRAYMFDFIHMFAPNLDRSDIEEAVFTKVNPIAPRSALPELP